MKKKNNVLNFGSRNLNKESWEIYHPNGKHMFTSGEKKVNWYISRNLAKIIGENKIQLTFTPNGIGFNENEKFGRSARKLICVITGKRDNLQRHHITPYSYRRFLNKKYKSRNHHDVVLINQKEHIKYEKKANEFKDKIAEQYNIKTIKNLNEEFYNNLNKIKKEYSVLLSALKFLFKTHNNNNYNNEKINKLKFISENCKISYEFLIKCNYIQLYKLYLLIKNEQKNQILIYRNNNKNKYDHGYLIVEKLNTEKKIKHFVKLWRKHFIKTTKPKYMPYGWSVNFRIKSKS